MINITLPDNSIKSFDNIPTGTDVAKTISEGLSKLNQVEKPLFTKFIERVLNTKIGDWLDSFFLKVTYKKWKVKFNKLEDKHFNIALKSTKNVG